MILTVDVGNTNIVLGGWCPQQGFRFVSRLKTDTRRMCDQFMVEFRQILDLYGCAPQQFDGAIMSCVVPPLQQTLKIAIERLLRCRVITVSPGTKTGMNIKIDNPAILGSDLVCGAVAAMQQYPKPCIIIDLGTATKFTALNQNGDFIGASILPGINISLEALSQNAAQLPHIDFSNAKSVIGTNTIDSMKSGIVFGTASMIDGMIDKFVYELGSAAFVVATGGLASAMIPYCSHEITVNENLVLEGLLKIYQKNVGK